MTSRAIAAARTSERSERYEAAERALWERYGLHPTERFIQLDSPVVRLRVLEVGSGRPLLFVHGTVGSGSWPSLIRELHGFRCIVLDRPGWGSSSPLDFSKHDYRTVAADILAGLLDALDIDRVDLVAGSIGDVWALSLAERFPARVRRMVLLGAGPVLPEIRAPRFIRTIASPIGALIVRLPVNAERVRSILRGSGHGASLGARRIPDEFVDWRISLTNDTASMRHERDMVRSIIGRTGWRPGFAFLDAQLGRIGQPTLLVHGTADPLGSVDIWRRFVRAMPHGELRLVDGAGHMPWFDDPEGVARQVEEFIAAGDPVAQPGRSRSSGPT
jgi:pimeloyl-ACP methyl ester carboxylesterase